MASAVSGPVDPANDWSGVEPAALRARRRAEFWPQVFRTTARGLFLLWGIALVVALFLDVVVALPVIFSPSRPLIGWWLASVALSCAGGWLSFRVAADLDTELADSPEIPPAPRGPGRPLAKS